MKNTTMELEESRSIIVGKNNTGKTSIKVLLDKHLIGESANFRFDDLNCELQDKLIAQIEADKKKTKKEIQDAGMPEFAIKLFLHIEYDEKDDLSNLSSLITDLELSRKEVILGFAYRLDLESYLKLLEDYNSHIEQFAKVNAKKKKEKKGEVKIPEIIYLLQSEKLSKYFRNILFTVEPATTNQYVIPSDDKLIKRDRAIIRKLINYKFINAERDSLNRSANQEAASTLTNLAGQYWDVCRQSGDNEELQLRQSELEAQFMLADSDFTEIYHSVFQETFDEIIELSDSRDNLTIESSLQAKSLLRQNTTVKYKHQATKLPEDYNGLGYMNLIEIIFKLKLLKKEFEDFNDGHMADISLLFIEEPEAHMHPQMQVIFIRNIENLLKLKEIKNVQTILSTHSAHIAANADIDEFKYFINTEKNGVIVKNLHDLKPKGKEPKITDKSTAEEIAEKEEFVRYRFIKQYITLNAAEVFFADKLIFIEGSTERMLMPSIMKIIDNGIKDAKKKGNKQKDEKPLLMQNISILESGAHAKEFDALIKFLDIKTLIITDIDYIDSLGQACASGSAVKTSNPTIKYYFAEKDIEALKELKQSDRIVVEKILVSYQQKQGNYEPRSFEEAFIALNLDWLKSIKEALFERGAIKNKNDFDGTNYYEIVKKCLSSKTAFATSLIFESQRDSQEAIWNIPDYIKEGLIWLSK
ncbi:MAG: AAA family ATPase [Defluviitaleaceae bacterium]|nr:AAA family ATPase [Defluviitaleaceae bacterium]